MKCLIHKLKDASVTCNHCGQGLCLECRTEIGQENYCPGCAQEKTTKEIKLKRSPALAAILSFCFAGLGQIYNGQPVKGVFIFLTCWLVLPWLFGIRDAYRTAQKINYGELVTRPKTGCLVGFIIGVVLLCLAVFFLFLFGVIALSVAKNKTAPSAFKQSIDKLSIEGTSVEGILKKISEAAENYKLAQGRYPISESDLVYAEPHYLNRPYHNNIINGYIISGSWWSGGYRIVANPERCDNVRGRKIIIETGGLISYEDCKRPDAPKKEG